MLNPSTASESRNDPTVARCHARVIHMNGGRRGSYRVCNLFALAGANPRILDSGVPRGDDEFNDRSLVQGCRWADEIVCAWGGSGQFILERGHKVELLLRRTFSGPLKIFGLNASGSPKHPLYLPYATGLEEWT